MSLLWSSQSAGGARCMKNRWSRVFVFSRFRWHCSNMHTNGNYEHSYIVTIKWLHKGFLSVGHRMGNLENVNIMRPPKFICLCKTFSLRHYYVFICYLYTETDSCWNTKINKPDWLVICLIFYLSRSLIIFVRNMSLLTFGHVVSYAKQIIVSWQT